VKIQGQNEDMLQAACQQFLGKSEEHIRQIALETLEGHQRAIMGNMTVEVCCCVVSECDVCKNVTSLQFLLFCAVDDRHHLRTIQMINWAAALCV